MDNPDIKAELKAATEKILRSGSAKKLVVAGPGAGKTFLFKQLLAEAKGTSKERLVITFIGVLKDDLERELGDSAQVFTLHGYCQYLLRTSPALLNGLQDNFVCYPDLRSLVSKDWKYIRDTAPPPFVKKMRELTCTEDEANFYFDRCNYYNAVDFDDSVFRVHTQLGRDPSQVPGYALVLIDEFQDFNKLEASIIDFLASQNAIVIAGDDDQALYSQLRGASWDYIRAHHLSGHYEVFELPFCMRCPEVIVGAVNDIIAAARTNKNLDGRIPKPYRYYEPQKGADSAKYPHIEIVDVSVQRKKVNYFGRYVEEYIRAIPAADFEAAKEKGEPVAMIIGSDPYRTQVKQHLVDAGLFQPPEEVALSPREKALQILSTDPRSNLGWRIILSTGPDDVARARVRKAFDENLPLSEAIPAEEREAILTEAAAWPAEHEAVDLSEEEPQLEQSIAITSYEGSKGRSAQHVLLIGAHSGELPSNPADIKDLEICKFLVGLTRTKKKCSILVARNAMGKWKKPSEFLAWIAAARFHVTKIDASHWPKS